MTNHIFGKAVALIIVFTFALPCLAPLIDSIALTQLDSRENRISSLEPQNNLDDDVTSKGRPDGLAPKTRLQPTASSNQRGPFSRGYFYAYCAYDPSGSGIGPITFDTPENITGPYGGMFPNFCAGADFDNEGNWYGCDYAGGLYLIDPATGSLTYIAPTIGVNGMTFDGTTGTWYVTSSNNLFTMDVSNGQTTLIGPHGVSNTFIGIACDIDGNMYGYDALWTGDSTLYSIDKSTGAATAVGDMGYGMVYAQDMGFDRDQNILYIAAYFNDGSPSALMTCDVTTGQCTPVGNFEGGMEVDGLAIPWLGIQYDNDIAVTSIIEPKSGNAGIVTPTVRVKNAGLLPQYNVPIQLEIGKETISGTVEDFEATNGSYIHFPKIPQPDAWAWGAPTSGPIAAHSGANVWATNLAGNYPPSMWCILQTPSFVVPSGALFNFWHWYYFEIYYDGGNLKISNDSGVTWTLINPVGGYPGSMPYNPFMTGQPAYNGQSGGWKQANFDLSDYEGQTVQIIFETASDDSVQYPGWYIDDVGFTITTWANEYTQTAIIPTILPDEVIDLTFPTWAPADMGLSENININYNAEATALLVGDQNINNDVKEKPFTLHYGYLHDVAVTQIISPISGLAQTQTPEVVIENHGQNPENVNVSMTIGKALYTTLLEEDFADGVPPTGWGTNYPENWINSITNYAGGTAPEAEFSWTPSSVGEHLLYTGAINTTGYTALLLKFKEYVNDYNSDYNLKIVTSTDLTNWTDAYVRAGGPYGPTTTEVALTAANGVGSATLYIAWDMSGDSFNINYWYIDDIWLGIIDMVEEYNQTESVDIAPGESLNVLLPDWTPADIPRAITIEYLISAFVSLNSSDGNPTDNELAKMITLRYEHDVGVVAITQPFPSPPKGEDWLQYDDAVYANAFGSTTGHIYGANRFTIDELDPYIGWEVDTIMWKHFGTESFSGTVRVYDAGSATAPGDILSSEPFNVSGAGWFNITLTTPVVIWGYDLWLCVEGTHETGQSPLECSAPGISGKTAFLSTDGMTWDDLPSLGYDVAWEIRGHVHGWTPGTYPVEGIIQNYGVTYPEVNIPVHAWLTNDTGEVIYDETVNVTKLLAPGENTTVIFPDGVIPENSSWGDLKLTMQTQLLGDDHPENDKKSVTWYVPPPPDTIPPVTTATVSGTMGLNEWYISDVQVTLTAVDYGGYRWPSGVNHTYYNVDGGDWMEYTVPIVIDTDGYHTICFYSDDHAGNIEIEKCISFWIDKTPPIISSYTATAQNMMMTEWLLEVTSEDSTSGIIRVEFFADDALVGNVTTTPYEFTVDGKIHTTQCIVYDAAGNSKKSDIVVSYEYNSQQQFINSMLFVQQRLS